MTLNTYRPNKSTLNKASNWLRRNAKADPRWTITSDKRRLPQLRGAGKDDCIPVAIDRHTRPEQVRTNDAAMVVCIAIVNDKRKAPQWFAMTPPLAPPYWGKVAATLRLTYTGVAVIAADRVAPVQVEDVHVCDRGYHTAEHLRRIGMEMTAEAVGPLRKIL